MVGDFSLYFDESYTHPPEPRVYTVAGYISTDIQWKKFQKEWRRILEAEGVNHFHMVDFQACKPPYDLWSKVKRARFLASLHAVIHQRTMMSFATTANVADFESLSPGQQQELVNPHVFAAKNCMKAVGFWAAHKIINHQIIAYVFEQSPHDGKLRKLFTEVLTDEDRWFFRMASLTVADKRIITPLQAADVVAYESTKEIARKLNASNTRPARMSGLNLGKNRERDVWLYCDRLAFVESIAQAKVRAKAYPKKKH